MFGYSLPNEITKPASSIANRVAQFEITFDMIRQLRAHLSSNDMLPDLVEHFDDVLRGERIILNSVSHGNRS